MSLEHYSRKKVALQPIPGKAGGRIAPYQIEMRPGACARHPIRPNYGDEGVNPLALIVVKT